MDFETMTEAELEEASYELGRQADELKAKRQALQAALSKKITARKVVEKFGDLPQDSVNVIVETLSLSGKVKEV